MGGGQVGRPFIVREAELIALLDQAMPVGSEGMTLAMLNRWLATKGVNLSPSALYARLIRLVDTRVIDKDGTVYTFIRSGLAPTVEVD